MARRGPQPRNIAERFWEKVDTSGECWLWRASMTSDGYGAFQSNGRTQVRAHRMALMLTLGMFDQRMQVLHHCDNPQCVRPEHLYLGTALENMRDRSRRRPVEMWNHEARKTHCVNGHEFTPENTYTRTDKRTDKRQRVCRACGRAAQQARRDRKGV